MSIQTEKITISQNIIDEINSLDENFSLIAYDNDITPFQLVMSVLMLVVPLSREEAYKKTEEIHLDGKSVIYTGSKEHCQKIGLALDKIRVQFEINSW